MARKKAALPPVIMLLSFSFSPQHLIGLTWRVSADVMYLEVPAGSRFAWRFNQWRRREEGSVHVCQDDPELGHWQRGHRVTCLMKPIGIGEGGERPSVRIRSQA